MESHSCRSEVLIHLRDATPADTDTVVAILLASKEASFPELLDDHDRDVPFWTNRWRDYLAHGSRAQHSTGDGFVVLAETTDSPQAFAAFHHTTRHGTEAELQALYVVKTAQGRGLGTTLLQHVAQRLLAGGSRSLCVGYDPRNPYKRFYLKHGAVEINPHWAVWRDLPSLTTRPTAAT